VNVFAILKALHIVSVVAWFSGLFYIVRLFVYLREAQDKPARERAILEPHLQLQARRLWYGITWPAAIATILFGLSLAPYFWPPPLWFQLKLSLVGVLALYHLACHSFFLRLYRGEAAWTSTGFRVWNELATLLLVGIVFLVVLKDAMSLVWGSLGLVIFAAVLMAGITAYRRIRERPAR
jgi:putative membrane protein